MLRNWKKEKKFKSLKKIMHELYNAICLQKLYIHTYIHPTIKMVYIYVYDIYI